MTTYWIPSKDRSLGVPLLELDTEKFEQLISEGDVPLETKPLKHTKRSLIMQYIDYQPKIQLPDHSKHFYSMPMLNLKLVKRFVTFDNPCVICGRHNTDSIHRLGGV